MSSSSSNILQTFLVFPYTRIQHDLNLEYLDFVVQSVPKPPINTTAMSPIRLADFDSDRDGPDSPSYSGDENDRMLRQCAQESTHPKISGEQAIGERFNEPVAIVGIGKLISPALSTGKMY